MADTRTSTSIFDAVATLTANKNPEFGVFGGDLCETGTYSSWRSEFFRPNGVSMIARMPLFLATGNHEGWETNSMAFTRAPALASNNQDFYSFDYGDVHFLILNTEVSYAVGIPQYLLRRRIWRQQRNGGKSSACTCRRIVREGMAKIPE
jgi:hypothetical protein